VLHHQDVAFAELVDWAIAGKAQRDPVPQDKTSWGQSITAQFTENAVSARPEKIEDKPNEYFWPFGVWK